MMAALEYEDDMDDNSQIVSPFHLLLRHKRSANDTVAATDDGKSAIERFYDDPNNKAMFLVFPIFVLIICTCCGLYFCDKLKRHLKKKKAEKRKRENSMIANEGPTQNTMAGSIEDKEEIKSPRNALKGDSNESPNHSVVNMTEMNRDDSSLEDVENCPEISAVNAVPIKHRETSFMTDVRSANSSTADDTTSLVSTKNVQSSKQKSTFTADKIILHNEQANVKDRTEQNSRPSSKHGIGSANKNVTTVTTNEANTSHKREHHSNDSDTNIAPSLYAADKRHDNSTPDIIKPISNNNRIQGDAKRPQSNKSNANGSYTTGSQTARSNLSMSTHDRTSPHDFTNKRKFSKTSKKFTNLSPEAIGEILNYYKDKKHMPDIIPDDSENLVPIKKKSKRGKYRVFNG